ncbi:MAG: hypothetical protein ABIS28_06815 [Caldimonas sp.]
MRVPLAVAAVLLCLYSAFVAYGPRPRDVRLQSGDQQNRHVIETFMRDPGRPAVVLVGSSMSERLGEEIGTGCAYNLALGGESALTGLAVLAKADATPKQVFIETNVPERGVNARLVDEGTRALPRWIPALATRNMPVNLLFSALARFKSPAPRGADATVLRQALDVQRDVYAHPIPPGELAANLAALKAQVRRLEGAGSRVVFFELPIHPSLEGTPRALQIRAAFVAAFPSHRLLTADQFAAAATISTIDGVHLTLDEAKSVGRRLQDWYGGACEAPTLPTATTSHSISRASSHG